MLPTKVRFRPDEPVVIELTPASHPGRLTVEHLGVPVASVDVPAGADTVNLGPLPEGGYAVTMRTAPGTPATHTAVEVLANPVARMRYGFVASFAPDRDTSGVTTLFRRLHLTAAQFYDWAWRHANLVGPADYRDPLGQQVSMATVRALTAGFRAIGTLPLGYAAVYAVGEAEWPSWRHLALLRPDGTPHNLSGFLSIVDPSAPEWLAHFCRDLERATDAGGFAGFHLDQYGFPRRAMRVDGTPVDVSVAFDTLIRAVRRTLPDACLVFNNVNDFPVWTTAESPVDVSYTEVWPPHDLLADLAAVAHRSRMLAPGRPVVLAAYQSVYSGQPADVAERATALTMATVFSHGATQLLAGEAGSVLVDPYYVRNHPAEPSTLTMLTRWYDLLVAAGDVLTGPDLVDVTRSVVGALNDEVDVHGDVPVSHEPRPKAVWRRVVDTPHGRVVHLINLTGHDETGWDTPKGPVTPVTGLRLRLRRWAATAPTVRVADPDQTPCFVPLPPPRPDGTEHVEVSLPPLRTWQLVLIRDADAAEERS